MTLNYERRNSILRTRELLVDILWNHRDNVPEHIWEEVGRCLKHYPGEYDMELAAEQAPEVFGNWEYYRTKQDE